jgi:hypothetical protein
MNELTHYCYISLLRLVFRYPTDILKNKYDPEFPIRGLYYDTKRGNLLKMDFLNNLQMDSVYFGRRPLKYSQILEDYGGTHVTFVFHSIVDRTNCD